jgi:hypothetical protein
MTAMVNARTLESGVAESEMSLVPAGSSAMSSSVSHVPSRVRLLPRRRPLVHLSAKS